MFQICPGGQCIVIFWWHGDEDTGSNFAGIECALQKALEVLSSWTNDNMVVNTDKTTFQVFSLGTKHHDIEFNYQSKSLIKTYDTIYLCINLNTKLTWKKQIDSSIEKGQTRSKLLKYLAGITWGSTQDVLCTAYKSYIRPVVEYGSEVLITASESTRKKLDIYQNSMIWLITGAAKSTIKAAMEIQTELEPLSDRFNKNAMVLVEKIWEEKITF